MRVRLLRRRRAVEDGLKVPLRVLELPRLHVGDAPVVPRLDEVGVELERVDERLVRARVVLLVEEREPERVRDPRIPRASSAAPASGSGSPRPRALPGAWRARSGSRRGRRGPGFPSGGARGASAARRTAESATSTAAAAHAARRSRPHADTFSGTSSPRNSRSPECPGLVERGDDRGVERLAGERHDLRDDVGERHRLLVRARRRHGVEGVGHGDDRARSAGCSSPFRPSG